MEGLRRNGDVRSCFLDSGEFLEKVSVRFPRKNIFQ